jgi:predicted ester cyclase
MATQLSLEQMKQIVRDHFEDFVNKRNASVIRKNMTPDFYDHDGPGGKPTGVDGDEQMMVNMYKAMPDLHLTIEEMIAEDDKVVCRNIWRWRKTCEQIGSIEYPCSFSNLIFGAWPIIFTRPLCAAFVSKFAKRNFHSRLSRGISIARHNRL